MNLLCWSMAPSTRVTRKWEVFAGRNKFYCDGYLMSAPNTGVFYFTVFLITFTSVLFFAFDCPYLTIRITPAIPVVGGLLFLFTMGSLLRTTFTDPGVIPRASQDEAAYIEKQIEVPNSLNSPTFRPPPRTKEVLVKGQTVKLKYCFTCKIFRPPRASHCSLCDNCVDRFDHHCPWVGNCVGKRNYRFFYMFIVSLAFLAVFIFSCSLTHLILLAKDGVDQEFVDIIKQSPFSLVVSFICFLSIWSVIGLAGFHTYLTTSDQTTNEDIKGSFSTKGAQHAVNPYSHGNICMNCFYILCGPMTPSLIDRRGIVTDEYRIQMQQPERYNNAIHQPLQVSVSAQARGSNDQINKLNYYDIEAGPTLMNSGIYRQRSYDNLQNGNSNSVAHLVENELPISTLHSPVTENSSSANGLHQLSPNDDDDDDNIENLSNRNNLSGSYSNLFRDKLDEDEISKELQMMKQGLVDGGSTGAIHRENVYSNIPNTILAAPLSPVASGGLNPRASASGGAAMDGSASDKSDPSLHVYSNIVSPTATRVVTATASQTKLNDSSFGGIGGHGIKTNAMTGSAPQLVIADDSFISGGHGSSSTLLADDLDLDDPVIAAGTFGQTPKKQQRPSDRTKIKGGGECPNTANIPTTNVNTAKVPKSISMEMKNVIPHVGVVGGDSSTGNGGGNSNSNNNNNNNSNSSNAFCSPSRMRLLHDTTMIDTALDLDSLDGSSLGNNSQACLVKTAIV